MWTKSDEQPKPPPAPEGHPVLWKDEDGKTWALFGNPLPRLRCPATFEAWQDPATWEVLKPQKTLPTVDGGKVTPHTGSIAWNAGQLRSTYRKSRSPCSPTRTASSPISTASMTGG